MMDMIEKLEAKQSTLAELLADLEFSIAANEADVTLKYHFRQCHQCGEWRELDLFPGQMPIECRPICFNCQSCNESQSPA